MELSTAFLFWSLFFPRITLMACWATHHLPFLPMASWLEFLMFALVPRLIVLMMIYNYNGVGGWFLLRLFGCFCAFNTSYSHSKSTKKI